jgi:hypothetical protein
MQDISIKYEVLDQKGLTQALAILTKNVKTGENRHFLYRLKGGLQAPEQAERKRDDNALPLTNGGLRIGI